MITIVKQHLWGRRFEILEHILATSAAVVSRVSMLIITLINTHFLPPIEFGLFAVLMLVANIVNAFVSCGGDMWLNRFTRFRHANTKRSPIIARFYLQISFALALMVVICALIFATIGIEWFDGQGLTIGLALLWAACAGLIETILAIVRTTNNIQRFFVFRDFLMPIALVLSVIITKTHTAASFYLIACIIWGGTLGILLNFLYRHSHLYIPRSLLTWSFLRKGLFSHTIGLISNNFLARVANGFDTFILARFLPLEVVGRYRFGAHFANAFTVVQHFAFLALPWHFRSSQHSALSRRGTETVLIRQILLLLMAGPVLVFFITWAHPIVNLLGKDYQPMITPFCILLVIRFSELLWGPQHEVMISNNKVFLDTVANILAIIFGVSTFFFSKQFLCLVHAAIISAGVSSIIGQLTRFVIIKKLKTTIINNTPWMPIICILTSLIYLVVSGAHG